MRALRQFLHIPLLKFRGSGGGVYFLFMIGRRGRMMLRAMIGQSWIIAEETSLRLLYSILSRLLSQSFCRKGVDWYIPCSL